MRPPATDSHAHFATDTRHDEDALAGFGRRPALCRWGRFFLLLALGTLLPACRLPIGRTFSKSVVQSRQLTQQGLSAIEHENWHEAERLLAEAVKTCGSDPEARRNYARVLWQNGSRREAVHQLDEAIRLAPDDPALYREMADFQMAQGDVARAKELTEEALDRDPHSPASWASRGKSRQQAGQLHEALADYHRSLGLEPNQPEVLLAVAQIYRQMNEPDRALAALQTLREQYAPDEEPAHVYQLIGLTLSAMNRHEDAVANFELARQRGDHSPDLLFQLAQEQLLAGQSGQAEETASQLLAQSPGHSGGRELIDRIRTSRVAPPASQLR